MSNRIYVPVAALSLAAALGLGPVSAARADEAQMAKAAKVSIIQAIEAAEAKGGGKATEADFEDDNGGRWEIKVVADGGNKLTEYYVDPNSGQVTGEEEQTFEKYFTMLKPEDFAKAPGPAQRRDRRRREGRRRQGLRGRGRALGRRGRL
jgi:hypothetical protein